jgi:cell division inhibitor SepF
VVVDLQLLDASQAQRFIDFLSGAVWSLDGTIERVSEQVIVAAPMSVLLSS